MATDPVILATDPVTLLAAAMLTLEGGIIVINVLPALFVAVATLGAPAIPVLAAPLNPLIADSTELMQDWYSVGTAASQDGTTVAARAELMMDCGSPVILAAEAALSIAD